MKAEGKTRKTGNHERWARSHSPLAVRRAQDAFTLVEVMIVVGMVAIIMAWGLPSFVHALQRSPMRQAVNDIMEGCSHARAHAILSGAPAEFVIRADGGQLLVQPAAGGSGGTAHPGNGGSQPAFSARLGEDIAIEMLDVNFHDHMKAAEARVRFHPNGTSDEFTIVIRSPDGEWRKISLEITTGLANLEIIK